MGAHEEWTKPHWPKVGQNVLDWVSVDGDDASRSSPLVVDLVDVLVELWMVEEPACKFINKLNSLGNLQGCSFYSVDEIENNKTDTNWLPLTPLDTCSHLQCKC